MVLPCCNHRCYRTTMSSSPLTELDSRGSILFLGSGFSRFAKNIRGENLPTGRELRERFAQLLKVEPDAYDLPTLADAVNADDRISLYDTLYETFTVATLAESQKELLKLPWLRIYTTNYDDSIEMFYQKTRGQVPSFSYNEQKPRKIAHGTVVHLHGMIRNINEDNLLEQLVLNETAYVRQHFETSLWYDEFIRDLKVCSGCYFVGYSLNDYHISAILLQKPGLRAKTFFITDEVLDSIAANSLRRYGHILPIGMEKFSGLCKTLPAPAPGSDPHSLRVFRYLDPVKDRRPLSPPTAIEILNLLRYGTFNYQRCMSTLPRAEYVVPRQRLADVAVERLESARCLLVHSRIGNGKTTFLYILGHKLLEAGYRCFWCKPNHTDSQSYHPHLRRDIQTLRTFDNPVIIFDSYDMAIELADALAEELPRAKFIVAVRTGVHSVRTHEILAKLPDSLQRINLNGIRSEDVRDFRALLDSIGIPLGEQRRLVRDKNDFRDVMLALFDNKIIRDGISQALGTLLDDVGYKRIFIVSHLLKWVDQEADEALLRVVTGSDPYLQISRYPDVSADIFNFDDDNFGVRSSILSEYLIKKYLSTDDVIAWVYKIVVEAVKRKGDRSNRTILRRLMRFSTLYQAFRRDAGRLEALSDLFERWRRNDLMNREPLFWLQYAILMTERNDFEIAESFIETAYSRAAEIPNFRTYQIDTYALRLLLIVETRSEYSGEIRRFDRIIEKLEEVRAMIGEESYRWHAIQVVGEVEPFVSLRAGAMSNGEQVALVYQLRLLLQKLELLSPEAREETDADRIAKKIERSITGILNVSPRH